MPNDAAIKAEEQRKIEEKAEKERAEAIRIEAIKGRIAFIASRVIAASNKDSKTITAILKDLEAAKLDEADYEEMLAEAVAAKITAIEKLEAMRDEREEEAKQRKAETIAAITSIAAVKEALGLMLILPGEAIDRAYELGFNDGANAGLSVGHGLG